MLQDFDDRLDPEWLALDGPMPVLDDVGHYDFSLRSSSAAAKKPEAVRRISLTRLSSLFSCSRQTRVFRWRRVPVPSPYSFQVGDVAGLLSAARRILEDDGVTDLERALDEDGGTPAEETRKFLARVRKGGYTLVGGLAVNGAYDGLMALIGQAFPGFS